MTPRTHKMIMFGAPICFGVSALACTNLVGVSTTLAPAVPAAFALAILFMVSVVVMPIVFLVWGLYPKFYTQAVATNDVEGDDWEKSPYFIAS